MSMKSQCEELVANLFAFLDAELDADLLDRLAQHLDECGHCHELADAELHLRAILKRCCCEQAPETLRVRIVEQLTVLRMQA